MDAPIASFPVLEGADKKKSWILSLYPTAMRLETDGTPFEIVRSDLAQKVETMDGGLVRRTLIVTIDKRRIFQLEPDAFAKVVAWIGPPTVEHLKVALKRRLGWVFTIGILYLFTSAPIAGLPFQPVQFALGAALIVMGVLSRVLPSRWFFLFDALWFLVLAVSTALNAVETKSWGWFVLVALQILLVKSALRDFVRFAPGKMADEATSSPR